MSARASRRHSNQDPVPGSPRLDRLARALARHPHSRRQALRVLTAFVAAGVLGRLAPAERVLAALQQTATCQAISNASTIFGGDDRLAQTFLAASAGKLRRVELFLSKSEGTSGDLVVQIARVDPVAGTPTNTILASTRVPSSALPAQTAATVTARFRADRAARLKADKTYAIILKRKGTANLFVPARNDNPCPDGALFKSESDTGSFAPQGNLDLFFTAFVEVA
jgi:hypothetical protein